MRAGITGIDPSIYGEAVNESDRTSPVKFIEYTTISMKLHWVNATYGAPVVLHTSNNVSYAIDESRTRIFNIFQLRYRVFSSDLAV
jgi:hypothetical protein